MHEHAHLNFRLHLQCLPHAHWVRVPTFSITVVVVITFTLIAIPSATFSLHRYNSTIMHLKSKDAGALSKKLIPNQAKVILI